MGLMIMTFLCLFYYGYYSSAFRMCLRRLDQC